MSERRRDINPFEDDSALAGLRGLPSFEEALARLLHTAEHGRPFGIVRGPAGTGKTELLNCVAFESRQAGQECGQIDLRRCSADEFAWRLACELGAAPMSTDPQRCWRSVEDTIMGRALARRPTLLLFDHLDAADTALTQQLQRLLAIAHASAGWCMVLCAGCAEHAGVETIARQHADLRIELGPLHESEVCELLQHIVDRSGCAPFTLAAMRAIHTHTGGLVRNILHLGRLCLLARLAEEITEVTDEIVSTAAGEVPTAATAPRLRSTSHTLESESLTS